MDSRASALRIFCFWLTTLLAGTAAAPGWADEAFKPPVIELVRMNVVKARLHEQDFVLHLRITNPNASKLQVRGLDYSVHLNDIELVADGQTRQSFTVPAHGLQDFQIPITTNLWGRAKPIVKLLKKKAPIPYRLSGEIKTGRLFGHTVPFSHSGEMKNGEMFARTP